MQRVMNAPMMGLDEGIKDREEKLKRTRNNLYKCMIDYISHQHFHTIFITT